MNNLEDTGEITPQQQAKAINALIKERAAATPPRWITTSTIAVGVLAVSDIAAFAIHAASRRTHTSVGVALGIHVMAFAVLWVVGAALLACLVRIRLDIARTAQQDVLDAYRHRRTIGAIRDALAAQPDIIRGVVQDVLTERDRAARIEQWMGHADHERAAHDLHAVDANGRDGVVRHLPQPRTSRRSS